eukprot:scaffold246302_cov19-Tisochrysis_lutea.AAC.1
MDCLEPDVRQDSCAWRQNQEHPSARTIVATGRCGLQAEAHQLVLGKRGGGVDASHPAQLDLGGTRMKV